MAVDFDGRKIFCESLLKPWIQLLGKRAVHQLVGVFVKLYVPGVLDRHVKQDEATIIAGLKQPCQLHGFPVPQGGNLAKFLGVAEGNDFQRIGDVYLSIAHQGGVNGAHLLEASRHFTSALVTRVGYDGEMWRTDFDPCSVARQRARAKKAEK